MQDIEDDERVEKSRQADGRQGIDLFDLLGPDFLFVLISPRPAISIGRVAGLCFIAAPSPPVYFFFLLSFFERDFFPFFRPSWTGDG